MTPDDATPASLVKGGPFVFPDLLRRQLSALVNPAKTVRTRARLEIAAAELLQTAGFHALTIKEVCIRAECGHGTFYNYWPNGDAIALAVLTRFMEAIRLQRPRAVPERRALFDRLVWGHAYYIETHRLNTGLSRCMLQLADERPQFAQLSMQANLGLAGRVVDAFEQEDPAQGEQVRASRVARALACIAMVDHLLYRIHSCGLAVGLSPAELAEELALIWYRTFCGRDPARPPAARPGQRQRRSSRS